MKTVIKNVQIIPGDTVPYIADISIENEYISEIDKNCSISTINSKVIDGTDLNLLPGAIDDQVHFREPGLTHKAEIYTEAKAAVAGGVTSYMEMPNTKPGATTMELLEQKYDRANKCSLANYSFFMGTTNNNREELKKVDSHRHCGTKIFMGSSTGDMLVNDLSMLDWVFANSGETIIAVHCEDDPLIGKNLERLQIATGNKLNASHHPMIRDAEACYKSSSFAVELAKQYNSRLHVLHITTAKELELFTNEIPLKQKRITAEVCVHHLHFSDEDYPRLGNLIKCNPAIKSKRMQQALWEALLKDKLDIIATDHAPHTLEEKLVEYLKALSGIPFVQHGLSRMIESAKKGKISLNKVVEKMCNNPAILFNIDRRGFIKEGHYADLVLVDTKKSYTVTKDNILYKCGWSPLEGDTLNSVITHTWVNGHLAYENGIFHEEVRGRRLLFNR